MKRRKTKPKVLVLSVYVDRSIARLAVALAFSSPAGAPLPDRPELERRARVILDVLRRMA